MNNKLCVTDLLDCKVFVENNQGTHLICFYFTKKDNTNTNINNLNFTNQRNTISDKQEKQRGS